MTGSSENLAPSSQPVLLCSGWGVPNDERAHRLLSRLFVCATAPRAVARRDIPVPAVPGGAGCRGAARPFQPWKDDALQFIADLYRESYPELSGFYSNGAKIEPSSMQESRHVALGIRAAIISRRTMRPSSDGPMIRAASWSVLIPRPCERRPKPSRYPNSWRATKSPSLDPDTEDVH